MPIWWPGARLGWTNGARVGQAGGMLTVKVGEGLRISWPPVDAARRALAMQSRAYAREIRWGSVVSSKPGACRFARPALLTSALARRAYLESRALGLVRRYRPAVGPG